MRGAARQGPSPTAPIVAVALNTFREAIRDRVLYLLLVFALLLIGTSRLLAQLTVGSEEKIIKDVGLAAISVFGVLTAILVGGSLLSREIERKTVYTLLAHPVDRWQFVVGKYVGLVSVLAINLLLMSLALFAILLWYGEGPAALAPAVLLTLVELAVIAAFTLLFASVSNPMLAAVATSATYVAGHLVWSLELLAGRIGPGLGAKLCSVLEWVLPNLDRLNVRMEAVHGLPIGVALWTGAAAYGIAYACVVLLLACIAFERREFP